MIFDQQNINRLQEMARKMGVQIQVREDVPCHTHVFPTITNSDIYPSLLSVQIVDLLEAIVEKISLTEGHIHEEPICDHTRKEWV